MKKLCLVLFLAAFTLIAKAQTVLPLYQNELKALNIKPFIMDTTLGKLYLPQAYKLKPMPMFALANVKEPGNTVFYSRMPVAHSSGANMPAAVLKPTGDERMVKRITVFDPLAMVNPQ